MGNFAHMHSDTRIYVFCLFFIDIVSSLYSLVHNSSYFVSFPGNTPDPLQTPGNLFKNNESLVLWTYHGPNTCHCGNATWIWTNQSLPSCRANCQSHDNCQSIDWTIDGRCYGHETTVQTRDDFNCCSGWFFYTMEYTDIKLKTNFCPHACTTCEPVESRCEEYCSPYGFCGNSPEYIHGGTDCSACAKDTNISGYSLIHGLGGEDTEDYAPNISSSFGWVICCEKGHQCNNVSPNNVWGEPGCFIGQYGPVPLQRAISQCQELDSEHRFDLCEAKFVKSNPDCFKRCSGHLFWATGTPECELPSSYRGYEWDKDDKLLNCNPTECSSPILSSLRCAEGFRNSSSLTIFGCSVQHPTVQFYGCESYWIRESWTECSVTCGEGKMFRRITCSSGKATDDFGDCPKDPAKEEEGHSQIIFFFGDILIMKKCLNPACPDTQCEYSLEFQYGQHTSFPTGYIFSDTNRIADESCTVEHCPTYIIGASCDESEGFYGAPFRVGCDQWNLQLIVTGCEIVDCSFTVDIPGIPWVSGKFVSRGRIVNEVPVYFHEDGEYVVVLQLYPEHLGYMWTFMFRPLMNENEKYHTDFISADVLFTSQILPFNKTNPYVNETRPWIIDDGWVVWKHVDDITFNPICSDPRLKYKIQPSNDLFSVVGDCRIDKHCISPERLESLSNSAMCRIQVLRDSFISMKRNFTMKSAYDRISIKGVQLESDTKVPESLQIGDTLSWTSSNGIHIDWAICFTEMKSEYDTSCKYNVQNHQPDSSSQRYELEVSNAAIYRYSEEKFLVGSGNYDTGVYGNGDMCKSFMSDTPSKQYSSAKIEWETEDLTCNPSTGYVEQTQACHYVFHICPCSQQNRRMCTYDFKMGTERTIRFEISNSKIFSIVRIKSLLGQGSYASGVYKNGETCKREHGKKIYHSARISWLDSSICEANSGWATQDDHCIHTVHVCPCTAKSSTKKGKVNLGDLATILLAVIIVLGLYLMSRCIIVFCMRSHKPANDDIELFDLYEGMVDDIQYKSDGCVNSIIFHSEGEDSMGDVSGVVFQEGEESEFFDMSASYDDSDNNIAYYNGNRKPVAARSDPGSMGFDPSAPPAAKERRSRLI